MKLCNGVFEGGGVRGIGHVGAACGMERAGYRFVNLAGASAGAIVAALLAAGYSCKELQDEMESMDYMKLKGKDFIDYFGAIGKAISIFFTFGIYNTDYLEQWMEKMLSRKDMRLFGDVKETGRSLKITASDLTEKRILILPDDLKKFGLEPDDFPIASAVKMSVSIPVFFEPVRLLDKEGKEHVIVDGGLLSNFPVWLLDDGKAGPLYPTFGFKFIHTEKEGGSRECPPQVNIAEYLKSIVSTSLDAIDNSHLSAGDFERTIGIPAQVEVDGESRRISGTDFGITAEESRALFLNGKTAAENFLKTWDFEEWKRKYRVYTTNTK